MNGKMEFVRAIVRPIITLSGWAVLLWMVATAKAPPEWFQVLVVGLTTWWYADRSSSEKKP